MSSYINRDGIGPARIEILRRIQRGEIKTLSDCGKYNPIPFLIQRNLVQLRGGRCALTLDGRKLLEEIAEEEGEATNQAPSRPDPWRERVAAALPALPERFKSIDVLRALNLEWDAKALSCVGICLRQLERQGLVECMGRDAQVLIWKKIREGAGK